MALQSDPNFAPTAGFQKQTDMRAMTVATALFFMVGALTCLNDVIIPHLKSIFALSYAEAMLVQLAFFSAYFFFSYPASRLLDWVDYKSTMVCGLAVMCVGALLFLPAAHMASFPLFLGALMLLATGMTLVQVAVNPYVTILGPAKTASSRLNLAQAFNSVGTFIAPFFGGLIILGHAVQISPAQRQALTGPQLQAYQQQQAHSVQGPYIGIAVTLALLAIALAAIKLKRHTPTHSSQDVLENQIAAHDSIWKHSHVVLGALGLFAYVGAEVAIGSLLVNYMGLPRVAGLRESVAANYLSLYWGGAMLGRFAGAAVLQRVRTAPVLATAAALACALVLTSVFTTGHVAMFALLLVGFCNSIMFPSIFTLGIRDLGALTSKGSSVLMSAAGLGGAVVPLLTGRLADHFGLALAFLLPALCYVYVATFGAVNLRRAP